MKINLSISRYNHCVAVGRLAREMAKKFGVDEDKAEIAGLFHDFSKHMDDKEALENLNKYHVSDDFLLKNPKLAHGKIASFILNNEYGLEDEEILSAIDKHTFGSADMTKLDKIVFLADAIEPARNYPECDKIRKIAEKDLDLACIVYLKENIKYLLQNDNLVSSQSIEMYNKEMEIYKNGF